MRDAFVQHYQSSDLIPAGSKVLVGYSGGPDSTCLLALLVESGVDVVAAHLNHSQRPEGEADVKHCQDFCDARGIPLIVGKADVPRIAADSKVGLEEAGREARYSFFRQAAFSAECDLVATGHTRDDLVETVLFHLSRGTGLAGLGGIPESRDGIVRPLLPFSRAETANYCLERGLATVFDAGNDNLDFARVRIRQRVIPELEIVHPGFTENVFRTAGIVRAEDRFLDGMAARVLEQSEIGLNGNLGFLSSHVEAAFRRGDLAVQPRVLLARAIRLAGRFLGVELDFGQTEGVVEGVLRGVEGSITADGGAVVVEFDREKVHFRSLLNFEPFRFPVTVPGETISEIFGWVITAESTPASDYQRERDSLDVVIDWGRCQGGLHLCSAKEGERVVPLGMDGSKLISDLLNERRLTLAARGRLPIISDMVGPVWIPGCCIADRVKVTSESIRALRLRLSPAEPSPGS